MLLFASLPAWAEPRPARTKAVSPDGKLTLVLEQLEGQKYWGLGYYNRQSNGRPLLYLTTQDAETSTSDDDAWGIYDFCWCPDSRLVLFVFRPYSSFSIGHSCDSVGIVDVQTKQYQWIAGKAVDGMVFDDYCRLNDPKFKLSWRDNNTVFFYFPQATPMKSVGGEWQNVKTLSAGTRTISVASVREGFVTRAKAALAVIDRLKQLMAPSDWQTRVRQVFAQGESVNSSIQELCRHRQALIEKDAYISFESWNREPQRYTLLVRSARNNNDFVQVVINSQGKIADVYQQYDYD